jgi:hypothetical protein
MMIFRQVKTALTALLAGAAQGRFTVIGNQEQAQGADQVSESLRSVQVFYRRGDFPKSGGSQNGPTKHDMTFALELTLGQPAKIDLVTINDPSSTPTQLSTAIANSKRAHDLADQSFDEFADLIYQILMDARNQDLGLADYTISNRWVGNVEKDDPVVRGQYVVISGGAQLTCSTTEAVDGDPGVEVTDPILDVTVDIDGDDNEKTGVTVD